MYTIRAVGATALAAVALMLGLPGVAHAMPASSGDRAVTVTVKNHTNVRLTLSDSEATEGDWTTSPPNVIKGYKTYRFGTESTEYMGGTEASATYSTRYGDVDFYWSDPWQLDNEFTCTAPPQLTCDTDGDLRALSKVTFDIYY